MSVAKNYLSEAHVQELNRIVSAYLDLAENRAHRGILMKMQDWAAFLNGFLELSSYPILADNGKVTALEARLKAEGEYEVYRKRQDAEYVSDFDRVIKEAKRLEGDGGPKRLRAAGGPTNHPTTSSATNSSAPASNSNPSGAKAPGAKAPSTKAPTANAPTANAPTANAPGTGRPSAKKQR